MLRLKLIHVNLGGPQWYPARIAYSHSDLQNCINTLHVKFFSRNIDMYFQFLAFLHTNMTQVVGILPHVRQGRTYFTLPISWLLMS